MRLPLIALALLLSSAAHALEREPGLREAPSGWHAFTEARLVIRPGQVVEGGTLLVKDGRIVAAGAGVSVPAGARVWKLAGRSVYAGFIDLASPLGLPDTLRAAPPPPPPADPFAAPSLASLRGGAPRAAPPARGMALRNPLLRAEQQAAALLELKPAEVQAVRRLGFTAVVAAPSYGLLRGQGALLALGEQPDPKQLVLAAAPTQHLGLDQASIGQMPSSLMGVMATLRQALLDARWRDRPADNATLNALQPLLTGRQLAVAQARDEQDLLRWVALRDEFALPRTRFVLQGSGHEYRLTPQLVAAGAPLLLPLVFPEAPALNADSEPPLHELQHWEAAPANAARLHAAGLSFAFTAQGVAPAQFWPRVRQAVRSGLPAEAALAALTTTPAALLGEEQRLGQLTPGRLAHAVVMSGDPFVDAEAEPLLSLVGEQVFVHPGWSPGEPRGRWQGPDGLQIVVAGSRAQPQAKLADAACALRLEAAIWQLRCGALQVQALQDGDQLVGQSRSGFDAPWQPWTALRVATHVADAPRQATEAPPAPSALYPAGAYGVSPPPALPVLLRQATLWTQGPAGTRVADLLLQDGRIAAVGNPLRAPAGAQVIDATGLHITPGLIDAHSHIAMARNINEFSDAITAETRVADALDATDITLYRQLAGGVTTANVLHGSANAIGGQSAVIKLRWGERASALPLAGATPSIKFALGENPKQASVAGSTRYPQTRMGVEQLLADAFAQARHYAAQNPATRRRDLRLESLAEVLAGQRVIHAHSYRADEILMFTALAREQGLKVAAFQHVLEGYKVAAEIAQLGAGASSFADWWGYKAEAWDAVVPNATLLTRAGVLTSLNSDDAELGRHLNTEAAKAMRGPQGLSAEQALALVTINPARQLGVAHLVGSLEPGKQADVVLWSGPPLSSTSRVLSTWVDGRKRFDREQDAQMRVRDAAERARLLQKVAAQPPAPGPAPLQQLLAQAQAYRHAWLHTDYGNGVPVHECLDLQLGATE